MKKLNIGIMGCAAIARRSVIPAIQSLPDHFALTAIASRTPEKAEAFAAPFGTKAVTGYERLLDDPDIDVLYIPLPTGLHEEWVVRSLKAGKHVLVEKSLAIDHDSAGRLVDLARRGGVVLMEDFMFKYHSQHDYTWKLLNEDRLGEIRLFRSQFGFPPLDKNNFRYDRDLGGGALLDAGAYTVKAAQWFLGEGLDVLNSVLYVDPSTGADVLGNATLLSKKGVVAQLSFGFDNFYSCNYEFWGAEGRLLAERAFTPKPAEQPVIVFERPGEKEIHTARADNHFVNILREFHQAVVQQHIQPYLDELLDQSRVLTEIKKRATKIVYENGHIRR